LAHIVLSRPFYEVTPSPNTVHFRILMAAAKSIQVVGWGTRGRSL
jgi:hypothetical protein